MAVRSAKEWACRFAGKIMVLVCGSLQEIPFYEASYCSEQVLGSATVQRTQTSEGEIVSNPEMMILAQCKALTYCRRRSSVVDEYSKQ